ncbi:hypothetical protein HK107_08200 [Parvularcula sp. ZS-1/3]|uniref:Uncharacterized protein n=1 Tax=Parvularcula mediterranea TaxID=2732508 RepID=A0A7Y3RLP8_9PROT|nr:hypothetical protein [Parvularcula mediterranea]NNU16300.1 hypothetical protein [Parvularcula mediterranea]
MKKLVSFAAAALMATGVAAAQGNSFGQASPRQILDNLDVGNVQAAVVANGQSATILSAGDGSRAVGVQMSSGVRFVIVPAACRNGNSNCAGASFMGLVQGPRLTGDGLNAFNSSGVIPKAIKHPDGVMILHYMIADYGFVIGNFRSQMAVMDTAVRSMIQGTRSGSAASVSLGAPGSAERVERIKAIVGDAPHEVPEMSFEMREFLMGGSN